MALCAGFDPEWGGFGGAPKFPPASVARVPAAPRRAGAGDEDARRDGRRRDVRPGRRRLPPLLGRRAAGSSRTSRRCSTTTRCSPPTYLHAWVVTGEERYRAVVEETLEYVLRELALPEGGFASSQDADTEGVEGLTFTWTEEEGVPAELLQPFEHGRSIIRGELDPALQARLFEERERRPQPARDDKAIAAWNGLALAALAEAGPAARASRPVLDAARRLARVPARAALDARRPPLPQLARRPRDDPRLPRGLRRRRPRPLRAARRDRRAALARGVEPARAGSRSSSSPTRSAAASS